MVKVYMAVSKYPANQYTSAHFVGSGCNSFSISNKQACLIHYLSKNEWLLPKGRRNCGESRCDAMLREARGEAGYNCHVYPVSMVTRAPQPNEPEDTPDIERIHTNLTEPLMVTIRELSAGEVIKLIFWYIAQVGEKAVMS